jgi:hypothetical protein
MKDIMQIIPMGAPLKYRWTNDITKLIGDFCISAKASKIIKAIVKYSSYFFRDILYCTSRIDNDDAQNLLSQNICEIEL